jgi:hypothetical protein
MELDEAPLHPTDESLVESRLAVLRDAPASAVSLEAMKKQLRALHGKSSVSA